MKHFKVISADGSESHYNLPQNWHEVTVKQYQQLRTKYHGDEAHFLEILSGLPRETWMNQEKKFVEDVLVECSWIGDKQIAFDELEIPKEFTINDNQIQIPGDLGLETFGQKVLIDNRIKDFVQENIKAMKGKGGNRYMVIELIDYVCAVYLCKWIVGKEKFDTGDLDIALLHVQNTPAYLIYPIAGFFLRRSIDSMNIGKTLSRLERRKIQRIVNSAKKPGQKD